MARRRYLVMYDICDDGRLRKVHQIVSGHGERMQYSVYVCDLSASELLRLRWLLSDEINATQDSVAILDMGELARAAPSDFVFIGVHPDLPSGEATVV